MRRAFAAAGLAMLIATLTGCDSGPKAGVPANIDMTKDYSPAAKPFSPGEFMDKADAAKKDAPKSVVPET
jgi:hypothetical protein